MPLKRTSEFQSTRLSRASTCRLLPYRNLPDISIHKALTSLDRILDDRKKILGNFNPQGSHEPRHAVSVQQGRKEHFNPQGSHEPRQNLCSGSRPEPIFQSTRLSRASTSFYFANPPGVCISIHKALTSLDSKNTQLSLHPCQIYIS